MVLIVKATPCNHDEAHDDGRPISRRKHSISIPRTILNRISTCLAVFTASKRAYIASRVAKATRSTQEKLGWNRNSHLRSLGTSLGGLRVNTITSIAWAACGRYED